ncbi:SDR family oxidoreductase [Winogradskya consettensis]|uniref:Retinol dehydrogenase n=1 Tax=Winogradskya consettensis TaxID=113560 RepID=A0A919STH9_9ACTN|nr:SDR family NAD(P)-dependent oxidoreductase [Actinoplanes consettensis]GIM77162.1 retinol dehydrogenase [Actinoplanes consettensis]
MNDEPAPPGLTDHTGSADRTPSTGSAERTAGTGSADRTGSAGGAELAGRVSLVTGATGGMGRVIATELARRGSTVVAVTRSEGSGDELREYVASQVQADRVEVLVADLASRDDLHGVAEGFMARHGALDLLINNAGAHYRERRVGERGVEMHVAVNHLAGFTLTALLLGALRAAGRARVINVVSASMGDTRQVKILPRRRPVVLDRDALDDLRDVNPADGFEPFSAYARAKLLTLMSGYHLAGALRGTGVTVNAVHPGVVATPIIGDIAPGVARPFLPLIRRSLLTPEQGAAPALWLATATQLGTTTGRYFNRATEAASPAVSYDRGLQRRIWAASARGLSIDLGWR